MEARTRGCKLCGTILVGRQKSFCCHEHGVAWRTKNLYHNKWTFNHRSKSPENFMKTLLSKRRKNRQDLSIEDLMALWTKQDGKCALTGVPMTHLAGQGKVFTNASIDRVDNSKDYSIDNIQLVCYSINVMKGELSNTELVEWCKRILQNAE